MCTIYWHPRQTTTKDNTPRIPAEQPRAAAYCAQLKSALAVSLNNFFESNSLIAYVKNKKNPMCTLASWLVARL